MLRYVSSISYYVENFFHKRILYFVKCFFCICSNDNMIVILHFVNVKYLD